MDWGARGGPTGNMDTGHIGHNKPDNSLFVSLKLKILASLV